MQTVNPYKTNLDQGNAYWMARISKEVYLKKSDINQMPDEEKILKNLASFIQQPTLFKN